MRVKAKADKKLVKYISDLVNQGYDVKLIKEELVKYGYEEPLIQESFKTAEKTRYSPTGETMSYLGRFAIAVIFVFYLALLTFLAVLLDASLPNVIVGFSPSLLTLILSIILLEKMKGKNIGIIWLLPLIFTTAFYMLAQQNIMLQQMDIPVLSALNLLVSYILVAFLTTVGVLRVDKYIEQVRTTKPIKQKPIKEVELEITPKKALEYIQSIEDKSKAINFVIGRVYRMSNGGTKEIRNEIKIKPEWYNEFSTLNENTLKEKRTHAKSLVKKIQDQLQKLLLTEKEVFKSEQKDLKNLKRKEDGSNKIIDVLKNNDKDPVEVYARSALEFCDKTLEVLEKL